MGSHPLHIAIIWHMHQPFYKDLVSGRYVMPWVRLHGIKSYYSMVALLDRHPDIRMTFNLVPSLLLQIEDYARGQADEVYLALSAKPADELSPDDQKFILWNFFMCNWDTMVRTNPRYEVLLEKRGIHISPETIDRIWSLFSVQDFRDLQVWFNLAWFSPLVLREDDELRRLVRKGATFTEEDKALVLHRQQEVLASIIPKYREAQDRGQIELSSSPFYHPIMPLVNDIGLARQSSPSARLPRKSFAHPEDLEEQLSRSIALHRRMFGRDPAGLWPPEGALSEEVLPLIARKNIRWVGTDEEILAHSLDLGDEWHANRRLGDIQTLFQPYRVGSDEKSPAILFRDRRFSDLLGFSYSSWPPEKAAEDMVEKLEALHGELPQREAPWLVSIILDGENPWENYPGGGVDFLNSLYTALAASEKLRTTTPSAYLEKYPPQRSLPRLHPGSWINHNFEMWIGQDEKNESWERLAETRQDLVRLSSEKGDSISDEDKNLAWECIYIAEGSDWNWWYGNQQISGHTEIFDELYRKHLQNAYILMGEEPNRRLLEPLSRGESVGLIEPTGLFKPVLDGKDTHFYEWSSAGYLTVKTFGGTMYQAETLVSHLYYGFDSDSLYLRLDANGELLREFRDGLEVAIRFNETRRSVRVVGTESKIPPVRGWVETSESERESAGASTPDTESFQIHCAANEILELAIPFTALNLEKGQDIHFMVKLEKSGIVLERIPRRGLIHFQVPTREFQMKNWYV